MLTPNQKQAPFGKRTHYPKARSPDNAHCGALPSYYEKLWLESDASKVTCGKCLRAIAQMRLVK